MKIPYSGSFNSRFCGIVNGLSTMLLRVFFIYPSIVVGGLILAGGLLGNPSFSKHVATEMYEWADMSVRDAPPGMVIVPSCEKMTGCTKGTVAVSKEQFVESATKIGFNVFLRLYLLLVMASFFAHFIEAVLSGRKVVCCPEIPSKAICQRDEEASLKDNQEIADRKH